MGVRRRGGLLVLMSLAAGFTVVRAKANLIGADLGWQYYAGGGALPESVTGSVTGGSFIDNGGVGGEFIEPTGGGPLPVFYLESDDTSITFDYSPSTPSFWEGGSPLSLSPTIYNGIAINLLSAGTIDSVSIDSATNMEGFSASNFSFTGNQIEIDWSGLSFTDSTVVTLDVSLDESDAPPSVPEPSTYSLMLLSLLGAGLACGRKLKLR
jgi:hypothetical protein